MQKILYSFVILLLTSLFFVGESAAIAETLSERLSGLILLQVEQIGEAWYVYPEDLKRYYLDRPDDAFDIMRGLGLGISNSDITSLFGSLPDPDPNGGSQIYATVNQSLAQRLSGYIILQVEATGEAYYIYPEDLKAYYLGRPADAFRIMGELGLGITDADLENIEIGSTSYGDDGDDSDSEGTELSSDFEPPTGAEEGSGEYGPWSNRLMSAVSEDGETWEKTGDVISDQADVPDLTLVDGVLYLYYTGWTVGEFNNSTAVAISYDQGETWVYKLLDLDGFNGMSSPVDPDIQYVDDVFRLFLTSDPNDGDGPRTYYAESEDGIHFEMQGIAFAQPGEKVLDPNTILVGNTWHYFAGGGPQGNWHATSQDGKTFTYYSSDDFEANEQFHMMSNGIQVGDVYRYWAFSNQSTDIVSFVTQDGYEWEYEGVSLAFDESSNLESDQLKDATVIQLDDGSYLMVYVTGIPE